MVEKKNPDYSASAIKLTNPPEVIQLYGSLKEANVRLGKLNTLLDDIAPELRQEIKEQENRVSDLTAQVKEAIKHFGSYQNIEAGEYAVITQAKTAEYHSQPFLQNYPQFVPAVIVQSVNPDALKGLVKGGLIPQSELEDKGVVTYKITERVIIK